MVKTPIVLPSKPHTSYGNVFDAANAVDLLAVQSFVNSGIDINSLSDGQSILSYILGAYYRTIIWGICIPEDRRNDEDFVPDEIMLPLRYRRFDIKNILDWFFNHGAKADACDNLEDEDYDLPKTPLLVAIENTDYSISDYLLRKGAYPNHPGYFGVVDNYLLEHMDVVKLMGFVPRGSPLFYNSYRLEELLESYGATWERPS